VLALLCEKIFDLIVSRISATVICTHLVEGKNDKTLFLFSSFRTQHVLHTVSGTSDYRPSFTTRYSRTNTTTTPYHPSPRPPQPCRKPSPASRREGGASCRKGTPHRERREEHHPDHKSNRHSSRAPREKERPHRSLAAAHGPLAQVTAHSNRPMRSVGVESRRARGHGERYPCYCRPTALAEDR